MLSKPTTSVLLVGFSCQIICAIVKIHIIRSSPLVPYIMCEWWVCLKIRHHKICWFPSVASAIKQNFSFLLGGGSLNNFEIPSIKLPWQWNMEHECRCMSHWTTGILQLAMRVQLVGGFNPSENISHIGNLPQMGVKKKSLKSPPSQLMVFQFSPTASVRRWCPDCFSMPRIFTWEEHDELRGMSHAKAGGPVYSKMTSCKRVWWYTEIMCISKVYSFISKITWHPSNKLAMWEWDPFHLHWRNGVPGVIWATFYNFLVPGLVSNYNMRHVKDTMPKPPSFKHLSVRHGHDE